ncbi:MAG TPA: hypothetical protein VJZ02_00655 [Candidatus Brocadiales bacterium]|nr:hypothetical protein [Candidatus Brocadiales bacterium]
MVKTSVLKIKLEIYKWSLLSPACDRPALCQQAINTGNYLTNKLKTPCNKEKGYTFFLEFPQKINVAPPAKNLTKWPKSLRLNITKGNRYLALGAEPQGYSPGPEPGTVQGCWDWL